MHIDGDDDEQGLAVSQGWGTDRENEVLPQQRAEQAQRHLHRSEMCLQLREGSVKCWGEGEGQGQGEWCTVQGRTRSYVKYEGVRIYYE